MRECPDCFSCYNDSVAKCPADGRSTFNSLPGDLALEGKYVLERRLGEGGMGVVYKAHHRFLKTTRAIKIIRPELVGNDSSFATRFHQEAMAAAAIGHPNIISVPDFGFLEEKIPFIVMEFIEGISLQDLMINEGRFTPEKALEYIRPIASAVGAAHAHGIVHRDLKPLNIMITNTGAVREQIRILDFGLAKIKSADLLGSFVGAKTTGIIGSPYYMSPEQWSEEETDKRCDIYSLGIILYQMLMGDVPFKGSSLPAVMKQHLMTPPPRMAGISPPLERAVHHALEKKTKLRTASTEDLIAELEQAILEPAVAAKPKPKPRAKPKAVTPPKPKAAAAPRARQELDTIKDPPTPKRVEVEVVASDTPHPASRETELLRKTTQKIRRKSAPRAPRESQETKEILPVEAPPLYRQATPPALPGRVAIAQHSIVNGFLRKRFMLPIAAGLVIVGVIGLFSVIYFSPNGENLIAGGAIPATANSSRDMVLIEGGTFTMGSDNAGDEQKGTHSVTVGSFYIDRNEVTNAEYAEFVKATGHPAPTINKSDPYTRGSYWKPWNGSDPPKGREHWPVCNVSAKDAEAFAQWLSSRDGVRYRLPTEEEWEFAARNGSRGTLFPWGDSWQEGVANLNGKASPKDVGSFPQGATQAGVLDMVGNAWEWTSSKAKFYDGRPVQDDPNGRVRRGGSFADIMQTSFQDATDRGWLGDEHYKFPTIGFRLVRDRQ
ncbi:MAG TPA: bifunctional serine/threonine-protein kinase/formylglycine-generating enzyme family protein [Pyrinomonadaceae bacterium]